MMVHISGGKNAMRQPPLIIFKNYHRAYPIHSVPDNVPGVCYSSSSKGWIGYTTWNVWLLTPHAIPRLSTYKTRVGFVDNGSSHIEDEDTLQNRKSINTVLRKFPGNATDLIQPADSFVIQKIKDVWRWL